MLALDRRRYAVAISWDRAIKDVDLDLQVVIVDNSGKIIDAVFHNNLSSSCGAVVHSGDKKEGLGDEYGELVWVDFTKMQLKIKMLIFVVAAASGGHLIDVRKGMITLVEAKKDTKPFALQSFTMERSTGDVDAVVLMKRAVGGRWYMEPISKFAEEGESFLDLLDVISDIVRSEIPSAPKIQEVSFNITKGSQQAIDDHGAKRAVVLEPNVFGVSISWDSPEKNFIADCYTLAANKDGVIIAALNRQNNFALKGALVQMHFTEPGRVDDDGNQLVSRAGLAVQVDIEALDKQGAGLVMFMLTCPSATLNEFTGLSLLVVDVCKDKSRARISFATEGLDGHSKVLVVLHKGSTEWMLLQHESSADAGTSPIESAAYTSKIMRDYIPKAPPAERIFRLQLEQGGALAIPPGNSTRTLTVEVAWVEPKEAVQSDVTVGLLIFDKQGRLVQSTESTQTNSTQSIVTVGSSRKVKGEICTSFTLQLSDAPESVAQAIIVINASNKDFLCSLNKICCNFLGASGITLGAFVTGSPAEGKTGLISARFFRLADRSWCLQGLGIAMDGMKWSDPDFFDVITNIAHTELKHLQPQIAVNDDTGLLTLCPTSLLSVLGVSEISSPGSSVDPFGEEVLPELPSCKKTHLLLGAAAHSGTRRSTISRTIVHRQTRNLNVNSMRFSSIQTAIDESA